MAQVYAGLQITRSRIPETSGRIIAGHIWGHVEFKPHHTKEPYRNNSLSRSLLNTFLFDILLQVTQEQVTGTHTLRIVRVCF